MTREIPLTQGKVALVDDADFEYLNQWTWSAKKHRKTFYAVRYPSRRYGKRNFIFMHRLIMNTPDDMETDHVDRDGLNNQRHNLRICTRAQNSHNIGKLSTNTSGYKGVCKDRASWKARLIKNGKYVLNKCFYTAEEAARAYDKAAKEHFGEFAFLNFPE
jgi:hypothetical protein